MGKQQKQYTQEFKQDAVNYRREHRRRPTKTGRTSLFSGLVYCPDCGAKLHFSTAKSLMRNQNHFRYANYKSGRGKCQIHYIRDVVLERIVSEAVDNLADFVRCYEPVFMYQGQRKTPPSGNRAAAVEAHGGKRESPHPGNRQDHLTAL